MRFGVFEVSGCEELVVSSEEASGQNYFMYQWEDTSALPPWPYMMNPTTLSLLKFLHLLHLNQADVDHLICNLTDAQASTLRHGHKGELEVWVDLIET